MRGQRVCIRLTWKQFVPMIIAVDPEIETAQLHRNVIHAYALSRT
jgi:hypothetical protein